ncbi:MAG TPA: hypothetical protein VJ998_01155 [Pseudomonadales bacterium]|nr:hypothetical protein [Pseudomonadales bacterium]
MSTDITCSDARLQIMDLVDQPTATFDREVLNGHLEHCEACRTTLAELWELQAMATRWRDAPVPQWTRRDAFFERRSWLPRLQIASAVASVVVLVLMLSQVQVSTKDGLSVSFGHGYVGRQELATQLRQLRDQQQANLSASIARLSNTQAANNQLVMNTLLTRSRDERRQDLSNLLTIFQDSQARQSRQTQDSLQYLVASQVQDRRDIKQLDHALRLVATKGTDL